MHLLLPLLASLLFVCGLLVVKRISQRVGPWTVTFIANMWVAGVFSLLWFQGGKVPSWELWWHPLAICGLYLLGQIFTFAAIEHGDVSVATPVFGLKVIVVALMLALFGGLTLAVNVWTAVMLAGAGIVLVQWTPARYRGATNNRKSLVASVGLAACAAFSFGTFDVVVQSVAPHWGPGRLLPISFWLAGICSLGFLPFTDLQVLQDKAIRKFLLVGTLLVALQALCIVLTLAVFGDAARVNVVYTLRGMWGVVLAWIVARRWGGNEAVLPRNIMLLRLLGASLLTIAVLLVAVT